MQKGSTLAGKLSAIETFVCVGQSESFTAAAKKLQITVSGVSRAVSRLEESLQVRLLNRTSRSISLTIDGTRYFQRCKQVLLDLEQAETEITDAKLEPRGHVRIQLPRALGKQIVIPALAKFCDRYPEIRIEVVLDGRALNLEQEGIDVALRFDVPADSPLIARKLCRVFYLACAAPEYIRQRGAPRSLEELQQHRLISHVLAHDGRPSPWHFKKGGSIVSLSIDSAVHINDMSSVAEAAASGGGIAYLADFIAADYLKAGKLEPVLLKHIFEGAPVFMVYPRHRHTSPRARALHEFLREILPPEPSWGRIVRERLE